MTKLPIKILVLIVTVVLFALGVYGNVLLKQKFDPTWFIPSDTYLAKWFSANKEYFPFGGDRVTIWCANVDYINEFEKLNAMTAKLKVSFNLIPFRSGVTSYYLMNMPILTKLDMFRSRLT